MTGRGVNRIKGVLYNIVLVLLIVLLQHGDGSYKKWVPVVSTSRGESWNSGRIPCPNDRVIFPSSVGQVAIQEDLTVTELVLPLNGELILSQHVSLTFPVAKIQDDDCFGSDLSFLTPHPHSWYDVTSWCVTSHDGGDCMASQPDLLHTEQIPCKEDSVSLVGSGAIQIDLGSGIDIHIGTMTIDNQVYTASTFKSYLATSQGKKTFQRSGVPKSTISISSAKCQDTAGCICHNDKGPIKEAICSMITCPNITCFQPVQPMGHCCSICGGILKMEYLTDFDISYIRHSVENLYAHEEGYEDVKLIVSRSSSDNIQIVIHDTKDGTKAIKISKEAHDMLAGEVGGNKFKVYDVKLQTAVLEASPQAHKKQDSGGSSKLKNIIYIILSVVLIAVFIGVAIFCLVDKGRMRYIAERLRHIGRRRNPDFEMDSVPYKETLDNAASFDNPMYGTQDVDLGVSEGGLKQLNVGALGKSDSNDNYNASFDNPLYGQGPVQEIDHLDQYQPAVLDPTLPLKDHEVLAEESRM